MAQLSTLLPLSQLLTKWASTLNPLLANPLTQGILLEDVALIDGVTTINHKLGRLPQGWIVVDVNGASTIYRSQPFNPTTLILTSSAAVTVSLWIF